MLAVAKVSGWSAPSSLSCAASTCHDADSPAEGLDLSSASSVADNLVGVASVQDPAQVLVVAGDPAGSYLVHKLRGTGLETQMPQGAVLCEAKITAVEEWIAAGADGG